MHELYLAEKIINEVENTAETKKAEAVTEVRVVMPEDEHYTPEAFTEALQMQAEGTRAQDANFYVVQKKTEDAYIESIKIK